MCVGEIEVLGPDFSNECSALVLSNVVLLRVYKSALANDHIRYEPRVMQQWENIHPYGTLFGSWMVFHHLHCLVHNSHQPN